jgi:hypothetical protein
MGPYSEERQAQRRAAILGVLARPNLSLDAQRIWLGHLQHLATTEEQYNARVEAVYSKMSFAQSIGD